MKGILLFGPPGCGKTLMARQIGKMLNAREPKVVNGPEILNKYVGESEANIRKLFADAEEEQKRVRDLSVLWCPQGNMWKSETGHKNILKCLLAIYVSVCIDINSTVQNNTTVYLLPSYMKDVDQRLG